uniref:hypothetical protein n=1 Tax=Roseovarius indicus TaxID=540747 RepID=UPI003B52970A
MVVGLDAVEKGHEKPDSLNISWNPTDPIAAARRARRFVLEAVLVRVSEALNQYVTAIANLPRFAVLQAKWDNEAKKKQVPSKAKKLEDLANELGKSDCFLTAAACLLIHWRNRVVHRNSNAKLTGVQKKTIQNAGKLIEEKYASLSVDRLLNDFDKGNPTLKDITTLIAMTIRLVRQIDATNNDVSKPDLDALMKHYGLDVKIEKIKLETSERKQTESIIRLLETAAPGLVEPYKKFAPV